MAARRTRSTYRGPGRLTAVPPVRKNPKSKAMDVDPDVWLANADIDVLICRGQKHKIPVLDPRESVDALVTIKDKGVIHLAFTCERCGVTVSFETLEDGILDRRVVQRKYAGYPADYHAPKDVTPTACFQETLRRTREALAEVS